MPYTMNRTDFIRAVETCYPLCATDIDARPLMTGIHVTLKGAMMRFESYSSYRHMRVDIPCEISTAPLDIILRGQQLHKFCTLIKKNKGQTVDLDQNTEHAWHWRMTCANSKQAALVEEIDGIFPDIEGLIGLSGDPTTRVVIDASEFKKAVEAVRTSLGDEDLLDLRIRNAQVTVQEYYKAYTDRDKATHPTVVSCLLVGKDLDVFIDADRLGVILDAPDAGLFTIEYRHSPRQYGAAQINGHYAHLPLTIYPHSQETLTRYVLMPCQSR